MPVLCDFKIDETPSSFSMKAKPLPDADLLRKALRYAPSTGKLYWRRRKLVDFPDMKSRKYWNTQHAGNEVATHAQPKGHKTIHFMKGGYLAHRVIWKLVTGCDPVAQIDHINGDGGDNRWVNLREADPSDNARNGATPSHNSSGVKGVCASRNGTWRAYISIKKKQTHLGTFKTLKEASQARRRAAERLHGVFVNHG